MSKTKGYIYVVMAYIIWGSLGLFIRNVNAPSFVLLLIGSTSAFVVMLIYLIFSGQIKNFLTYKFTPLMILYPVFQTLTGFSGYSALEDENVLTSVSMLVFNSAPLLVVVLAPLLIKEKSTKTEIWLAIMGFVGLVVFVLSQGTSDGTIFSYGMIFAIVGLVFNSISSVINRKISQELPTHYIPMIVTLGNMLLLWPYFFASNSSITLSTYELILTSLVGIVSSIVAFLFLSGGYKVVKVQEVGIIGLFQPVYIALLGFVFLDEQLTLAMLPGASIILLSNLLLIRAGIEKK